MPKKRTITATMGILKVALDTAEKAADLSGVPLVKTIVEMAGSLLDVVDVRFSLASAVLSHN